MKIVCGLAVVFLALMSFSSLSIANINIPPRIVQVAEGVQVAIGYALGNLIMLEGTDGVIVIDTTENQTTAIALVEEMRVNASNKPLKGIIITHNHADHIYGASALLEFYKDNGDTIDVYAHSTTDELQYEYSNLLRVLYQFGTFLPDSGAGSVGIDRSIVYKTAKPTITYEDTATFTCAGITFELIHIPGETSDHTAVWIADKKILMSGDDIYQAFPNLYSIRGTRPRDVRQWYKSLDHMRYLGPEILIPSHTKPSYGAEHIFDIMTVYRDGIQYVHDQTIRLMNHNLYVDDIVREISLPPTLANSGYLFELYGTVAWSVRGVFDANVGWFSGDAIDLNPLTKSERANKWNTFLNNFQTWLSPVHNMIASAFIHITKAKISETPKIDLQWALEISSMALDLSSVDSFEYKTAKRAAQGALTGLADSYTSTNAIHYYKSAAQELEDGVPLDVLNGANLADAFYMDLPFFMDEFSYRVDPYLCDSTAKVSLEISFSDRSMEKHYYILRNCIIEYQPVYGAQLDSFDSVIITAEPVWRGVVLNDKPVEFAAGAVAAGQIVVLKGGEDTFYHFLSVIEPFSLQ